jgi:hypothetical protein
MAGRGRKDADEVLALEIARGATIKAAAEKAGVSERTANRRQATPEFRKLVRALRSKMIDRATGMLGAFLPAAVAGMVKLTESPNEGIRLGALRSLIDYARGFHEAGDIEARLAALEAAAEQEEGQKS